MEIAKKSSTHTKHNFSAGKELNKRIKRLFLVFFGCVGFLFGISYILSLAEIDDRLIFIFFLPCAALYLREIHLLHKIRCPVCGKPVFKLMALGKGLLTRSRCPHCNAELRD